MQKAIKSMFQVLYSTLRNKNGRIAFVFLLLGLILTATAAFYSNQNSKALAEKDFASECNRIKIKISTRLHAQALVLRSGAAFFTASDSVTRNDWKTYFEEMHIRRNLTAFQGIGFSLIISKNQLPGHIQQLRKEGFPDYTIRPAGDREVYTSIIYLEPFSGRNLRAFGYDMFSDSIRRKAMEMSCDLDIAVLTDKVILVQETNEGQQAGTLMYVPVYSNGMPTETTEQRRAAIRGWVYSPFRMNDLMDGILEHWFGGEQGRNIDIQVYDKDLISAEALLYDSRKAETIHDATGMNLLLPFDFNGKHWTLKFFQPFESSLQGITIFILAAGLIISLLISLLIKSLYNLQEKSREALRNAGKFMSLAEDLEKAQSVAHLGNWKWNIQTGEVIWSDEMYRIFGIDKDTFTGSLGTAISNVIHPDDLHLVLPSNVGNFAKKTPIEYRIILPDQSIRYILAESGENIIDSKGDPTYLTGVAQDITERKNAELQLQESEERFRTMIEQAPLGIALIDSLTGHFYEVNERFATIAGRSIEEMVAMDWMKMTHPNDVQEDLDNMALMNSGKIKGFQMEKRYVHPDGKLVWINMTIVPIKKEDYKSPRHLSMIEDITDRRQAEFLLKQSEEKYRLLFDKMLNAFALHEIICDINGKPVDFKFLEVNAAFSNITGIDAANIIGKNCSEVLPTEAKGMVEKYGDVALAGKPIQFEDYIKSLGKWYHVIAYSPVKGQFATIFADITERKLAEELANEIMDKLLKISNRVPGVIFQFRMNPDGTFCFPYASDKIREIYQVSPEEVKFDATKVTEVIHPDDLEGVVLSILDSAKNLTQWKQEYRVKFKDGTVRAVYGSAMPQREEDGSILWHGYITDITERREAIEAIRASEERYKSILIASPDGIAITDLEGRVLMTSPVTAKMFGFENEDALIGKLITEYIVPEDRPLVAHHIELMFKGVMTGLGEYRALHKDGTVFYMEANAEFIRDASGAASQIVFIVRDISPRKKGEEQLIENQHFISEAQRISKLGSFKLNILTQDWYFSSELNKIFGMKPSAAHTFQAWQKMIHPDHQDMVTEYYLTVVAKKRRFHKEYKIINPTTGKEHWVSQIGDLKFDKAGNPVEMIGTIQDISKRKEAEVNMQDALNRYDILSNASSDTIWDWDIKTDTIIYNQGIINAFGYSDLRFQHAKDWWFTKVAPDDKQRVMELVNNTFLKKQETLHSEYRFLCANGKYKYVSDRSFVMYDKEGAPIRMIGSMQDITNEKEFAIRIEKEVIEAQEREWNQIGMELHDNVNQLLAASILMMGLAKVKMEQGLDASSIFAESEKHVGEAITEIRKLSHQLAPVSVYNLSLQQVFESLIKTINVNKQYEVTLEMGEFKDVLIPYKLQVNLYRILQAQLNNIIKYAKATAIIVSLKKSDHNIVFRIADNGIGFDSEKQHSGIGLENIRRRAKVFAGDYKLNTAPGKGCEVLVKIPLYILEQE